MLHKTNWLIIFVLLLGIVACTPAGSEPEVSPTDEAAEQAAPEALPAAEQALAGYLGVDPESLELEKIEDAEWSDGCLGLGGPDESCLAVITPGYAITFTVDGESYTVRTDLEGTQARVEEAAVAAPVGEIPPMAVEAARDALAGELGVDLSAVELVDFEQQEWSDSCLGLGGAAESCAAVVTPGYAVNFTVDGQSYTVRTALDGTQARVEGAVVEAPVGDERPPAVEAARDALAGELGVDLSSVEVVSFEQQDWSDSCLGLGGPAEICAAVITPGWQVMLMVDGQEYEVRTDFEGEQVRIADENAGEPAGELPDPDLEGAAVFFQRSGGLTGELLTVRIYADGTIERAMGEPSPDLPVETAVVDPAVVETLMTELEEAGYFGLERTYLPEDTCCDRYLYLVSVQGDESVQTVEALEATEAAPAALWDSVALIEAVINEAFSS